MTFSPPQPEPVATEPPEPLFCRFCDGQGEVTVSEFKDAGGVRHTFDAQKVEAQGMKCPICVLGMEVGLEVLA